MNSFKRQPKHVQQKLLEGNWEHLSFESIVKPMIIVKRVLKYIKHVGDHLHDMGASFVVAGGFPSWLMGLKYIYNDVDIFVHASNAAEAKQYQDKIAELYPHSTHWQESYFFMHAFIKRYALSNLTFVERGRKIKIQVIFSITKQRNLNHEEFAHGLIKHFPLGHIRIAMSYFSPDYTCCQLYRLDECNGHHRECQNLIKILTQYQSSAQHERGRTTKFTHNRLRIHRLAKIDNLIKWSQKHELATSRQNRHDVNIKRNLKLSSLCLQILNKRCLKNYGNDNVCKAAKLTYLK